MLAHADQAERFDVVLSLWGRMAQDDWYEVLGHAWPACDFVGLHWELMRKRLGRASREQLDRMMTPAERIHLGELPDSILVYRGCYERNANGLSWSLDWDTASKMPFYPPYKEAPPAVLLTGLAPRDRSVMKEARGEREIISAMVSVISVQQIWRDDPPMPEADFRPVAERIAGRVA